MANVIHVLKPFVFSYAKAGERIAREKLFTKGNHEVEDEIYEHPYIRDQFADGKIERPEATLKRIEEMQAKQVEANKIAAAATAQAQAAFARIKAAEPSSKNSASDIERELNTPVSQLKTTQGGEINESVNKLRLKANR